MAGFRAAACGMAGAATRWRERAAKGMSDDELAKALASEIGIFGGRSSPDGISLTYQGAGLKIWNSTMAMAREVYWIKDPADSQLALF